MYVNFAEQSLLVFDLSEAFPQRINILLTIDYGEYLMNSQLKLHAAGGGEVRRTEEEDEDDDDEMEDDEPYSGPRTLALMGQESKPTIEKLVSDGQQRIPNEAT